jgi:hypothetical protein
MSYSENERYKKDVYFRRRLGKLENQSRLEYGERIIKIVMVVAIVFACLKLFGVIQI